MEEYPKARMPEYANPGDLGADLFFAEAEPVVIQPGGRRLLHTGVTAEFPDNWGAFLKEKSGLANKHGLAILGGVIDSGYRGEIAVIAHNTSDKCLEIAPGDKLCQMCLQQVNQAHFVQVDLLSTETSRGAGGFGSTGR